MRDATRPAPTIIESFDLEAAAAALCCRFGEASAEAYRLSTLHDVLNTSRGLARALDSFTALAAEHYRGIHCTADMRGDAQRLAHALTVWSDSVFAAGSAYRQWTEDGAIAGLTVARRDTGSMTSSFAPIPHGRETTTAPPA
ncbi:MAG: hypothetical protein ABI601_09210 [bacterium]